jgi:O-acetyl-ADP-ribose deacetylase (regulator of RNase III)
MESVKGGTPMPLEIIRNDITKVQVDAIVNAANSSLLGGGGVDGAIHKAAGPELLEECRTLGGCLTGQAKITKGYKLPAKYVIHTVGPVWHGGSQGEEQLLRDCYRNSLALAKEHGLESIAFPLISAGAYGYPKDQAMQVAISVIGEFLMSHEMMVYLVVFDKSAVVLSEKLFASINQYIDDRYVEEHAIYRNRRFREGELELNSEFVEEPVKSFDRFAEPNEAYPAAGRNLEDLVNHLDETFSQMLLRLIDEKGMTDPVVYKKANLDRKLFSRIRNNIHYRPSKPTVLAFAISLKLNLDETKDLLARAGFALSHSSKFDIIVEYFIEAGLYNIFEINEVLYAYDQNTLGG